MRPSNRRSMKQDTLRPAIGGRPPRRGAGRTWYARGTMLQDPPRPQPEAGLFLRLAAGHARGAREHPRPLVDRLRYDAGCLRRARRALYEAEQLELPQGLGALERVDGRRLRVHGRALSKRLEGMHLADLHLALACAVEAPRSAERLEAMYRRVIERSVSRVFGAQGRSQVDELSAEILQKLTGPQLEPSRGARLPRQGTRYTQAAVSKFLGTASLATWIQCVAKREALDAWRRTHGRNAPARAREDAPEAARRARRTSAQARRKTKTLGDLPRPVPAQQANRQGRSQVARADEGTRAALWTLFQSAWRALADTDQARLRLHHVWRLPNASVGKLLGEHPSTTGRKLAQARARLTTLLCERIDSARGTTRALLEGDRDAEGDLLAKLAALLVHEAGLHHHAGGDVEVLREPRRGT